MINISHIINPVATTPDSRLYFPQMVTIKSMQLAKQTAADLAGENVRVNFFSAQFPEEHRVLPAEFFATPDLERSILDIHPINNGLKLPYLSDIIDRLYHNSNDEYFIYTNIDISLKPNFYIAVAELLQTGVDAFTVNRRSISNNYSRLEQLPQMYADNGDPHRGWDCFIFRRDLCPKLQLGQVCVGAPLIGLAMLANLLVLSNNFQQVTDQHWTFHLGNDRRWHSKTFRVYKEHNLGEVLRILHKLETIGPGFLPESPPGKFLKNFSTPTRKWLYTHLQSLYIPVKYTKLFNKHIYKRHN